MKKSIILFLVAGVLYSCSSNLDKKDTQSLITQYKNEVKTLNDKIKELETQMSDSGAVATNSQKVKVKTEELKPQSFSHYFDATGDLESIDEAFISPEISGQITSIKVKEGDRVKKGQVLARLNSEVIERSIDELKTQLNLAETLFNKQQELWNKQIGSERQYLESKANFESLQNKLKTLNAQYEMTILRSPINGFVEEIALKDGEMASPGMRFMQIVNLDQLYITSKISEAYLSVIKEGEMVEVTFPSYPELIINEPIYRVGNVINNNNRTFLVQVKVNNVAGKLKPNLLANIRINDYNSENGIVVPTILIKEDLKGSFVYVAEKQSGNWVATKKYITIGHSYRDKSEIVSGLSVTELIITDGYNNVSNGSVLEIIS